jgi:hypothetical protein
MSKRSAIISDDELYRYQLVRDWTGPAEARRVATFIMLNPSTADGTEDDPTIRRCIGFASEWGCTALKVVNLFAWRATAPAEMALAASRGTNVVGPRNADYLRLAIETATHCRWPLVTAWGASVDLVSIGKLQVGFVRSELIYQRASAQCLGFTMSGHPKHPLYVKGGTELRSWP